MAVQARGSHKEECYGVEDQLENENEVEDGPQHIEFCGRPTMTRRKEDILGTCNMRVRRGL